MAEADLGVNDYLADVWFDCVYQFEVRVLVWSKKVEFWSGINKTSFPVALPWSWLSNSTGNRIGVIRNLR